MQPTVLPYLHFTDKDGTPLDGKVFFGLPNQNPETNQITVYWDPAGTQQASQPIKVLNGFARRAGTPGTIYANQSYSILVRNSVGEMVFYAADSASISPSTNSDWLTSVSGSNAIIAQASPPVVSYVPGQSFKFAAANPNTGPVTIDINGAGVTSIKKNGTVALVDGDIRAGVVYEIVYDGTNFQLMGGSSSSVQLRSYLAGLGMSTAGSSATMTVAPGVAADSTNAAVMNLAASMGKTTSAWAAGGGNGGLDTGAIANNTGYHFFLIGKADGTTDILFSTSASSPTMPPGYTFKRRIGWGKTNTSALWLLFVQIGDAFYWSLPVLDLNNVNPPGGGSLYPLTVPSGVRNTALLSVLASDITDHLGVVLSCPDLLNTGTNTLSLTVPSAISLITGGQAQVLTNTSAQIKAEVTFIPSSVSVYTLGWIDSRGRDD